MSIKWQIYLEFMVLLSKVKKVENILLMDYLNRRAFDT